MNKICYLHLGLHKTASSSLQLSCNRNRKLLSSFDITYPIFKCLAVNKSLINHSTPIHSLYCQNPTKYHMNIRMNVLNQINQVNKAYLEQFERVLEEANNIILSGEGISKLEKDPLNKLVEKNES